MKNPNTLLSSVQDPDLLAIYTSAMEQAPLAELSVRESLFGATKQSSHSLDTLYEESDGCVTDVTDKLVQNTIEREGERPLPLVSATGRSDLIANLMKDNYPDTFQAHADTKRITSALHKKGANHLSFLALQSTSRGLGYAAVCRAYVGNSLVDPGGEEDVVHLDHMLVNADQRRTLLGIKMFKELLLRAEESGIRTVEMLTRESTSYRAFAANTLTAKMLSDRGYMIDDRGVQLVKGEGDQAERMYGVRVMSVNES